MGWRGEGVGGGDMGWGLMEETGDWWRVVGDGDGRERGFGVWEIGVEGRGMGVGGGEMAVEGRGGW